VALECYTPDPILSGGGKSLMMPAVALAPTVQPLAPPLPQGRQAAAKAAGRAYRLSLRSWRYGPVFKSSGYRTGGSLLRTRITHLTSLKASNTLGACQPCLVQAAPYGADRAGLRQPKARSADFLWTTRAEAQPWANRVVRFFSKVVSKKYIIIQIYTH
jgi:hypothetical protein